MKELASALAKAQSEIKPAGKDRDGQVGNQKYKYADLTSVWEACRAALTKNGLSVAQVTEIDGDLFFIRTILLHSSGEMLEGRYPLRPMQNTPQGMGSAISYARRYALAAMVGVVAEDDDGQAASERVATNGHAPHIEAKTDTMQGRKNEAEGVRKAREWVNAEAMPSLAGCKTMRDLNKWIDTNAKTIDRLKEVVPDEWEALRDKIDVRTDALNVTAAG